MDRNETTAVRASRPLHRPHLDVEQGETTISCLYPEILAIIFSYLEVRDKGRAAQVCSSWRDASYQRSVWRGVEAKIHLRRATPPLYPSLVRRGIRRVQVLSLARGLKDLLQGIPSLESLSLSGCYNVTDSSISNSFSSPIEGLTRLDLSLCKQVTDSSLDKISNNLKNLEALNLGGCCNITTVGVFMIARGLKNLKSLNIRSCCYVSDEAMRHVAGLKKEKAGGNLKLEYLGLQDCQELSDEALKYISQGLTSLQTLNLSFCSNITDSCLEYLAKMPSLRELNLKSCENISDSGIGFLAAGGSRISSLDVSFCNRIGDESLVHMSQGLFNLRSLSVSACKISDDGVCRLARTLMELESLTIGQCDRITDKSLTAIAASLTNLRTIDLYGCSGVSPSGIDKIRKMPNLSILNLSLCHVG